MSMYIDKGSTSRLILNPFSSRNTVLDAPCHTPFLMLRHSVMYWRTAYRPSRTDCTYLFPTHSSGTLHKSLEIDHSRSIYTTSQKWAKTRNQGFFPHLFFMESQYLNTNQHICGDSAQLKAIRS